MKKLIYAVLILVMSGFLLSSCGEKTDTETTSKSENGMNLKLYDLGGQPIKNVTDYQGQVVLLNFWATWCPPCKAEMPSMEKLYNKLKDQGFTILAVSLDKSGDLVKNFQNQYNYSFPIFFDQGNRAAKRFQIRSIPTSYILDKNGIVRETIKGSIDWSTKESYIQQLLDE